MRNIDNKKSCKSLDESILSGEVQMDFMLTVSGVVILSIAYTADKYGCHLLSRIGAYCSLMLIFSSLFFE